MPSSPRPTLTTEWPALPLPLPPVGGGSFRLRPWSIDDASALASAWADEEITSWLTPPASSVDAAARWVDGWESRRAAGLALDLVIDVDGTAAGEVGLSAFDEPHRAALVGYWVAGGFRGRGLASAGLASVAAWFLRDLGGRALLAQCDPANTASHRTAEAAGFRRLGTSDGLLVYACRSTPNLSDSARDS